MRVRQRTRLAVLGLLALSWTTVHAAALVPPSDPPAVALMYTGDVIGYLDPCG
ncbi:MAG: hypothetical protein GTN89_09225 [Acidobacteria bacterium]|nr:hypothetical protein [Acidobacteriota bacterium]NIM60535.1 hypothetical protein [Acidobacteriota bacterium]NIO59506.1 hypothetical protein [Acidobacteriota bacterium]NIQ30535.1 hypothetical protein [Acidobacteriota bacterium]NIQ85483.1 hypothetical protein [Acidobacteriota bacterium]